MKEKLVIFDHTLWERTCMSHSNKKLPNQGSELQSAVDSKATQARLIRALAQSVALAEFPRFMFASHVMPDFLVTIDLARDSRVTLLITGESGTGKELLAWAGHSLSNRQKEKFVTYNCAAADRALVKSELFGHMRGSFTGATDNSIGVIREADGGTLFLDEIGELPPEVQPMLLRFLQDGEVLPVGASKAIKADVRVIAATNRNLEDEVRAGRFRADLFERLNRLRFHIPPLRERREELPYLIFHFMERSQQETGRKGLKISNEVMSLLRNYDWPRNVRQLENEIYRLVLRSSNNEVIGPERLSPEVRDGASSPSIPVAATTGSSMVINPSLPYENALADFQRRYFSLLLEKTQGNLKRAAIMAEVDRGTLRERIKKLGIEVKRGK
jgi:DNA-binding NtrC family response regulator